MNLIRATTPAAGIMGITSPMQHDPTLGTSLPLGRQHNLAPTNRTCAASDFHGRYCVPHPLTTASSIILRLGSIPRTIVNQASSSARSTEPLAFLKLDKARTYRPVLLSSSTKRARRVRALSQRSLLG